MVGGVIFGVLAFIVNAILVMVRYEEKAYGFSIFHAFLCGAIFMALIYLGLD